MSAHYVGVLTLCLLLVAQSHQYCDKLTFDNHINYASSPPPEAVIRILNKVKTQTELEPILDNLSYMLNNVPKLFISLIRIPGIVQEFLKNENSENLVKIFTNKDTLELMYDFPCFVAFLYKNPELFDKLANDNEFVNSLTNIEGYKYRVGEIVHQFIDEHSVKEE